MSAPKEHLPMLLFGDFLKLLREKGFVIGPEEHIRIHQICNQYPDENDPDLRLLKVRLASLICRSPEEQSRLYDLFDLYASQFEATIPTPPPPPPSPPPPVQRFKWLLVIIGVLGIMTMLFLYLAIASRQIQSYIAHQQIEQTTEVLFSDTTILHQFPLPFLKDKIIEKRWNFGDGSFQMASGEVLHQYETPGTYNAFFKVKTGSYIDSVGLTIVVQDPFKPAIIANILDKKEKNVKLSIKEPIPPAERFLSYELKSPDSIFRKPIRHKDIFGNENSSFLKRFRKLKQERIRRLKQQYPLRKKNSIWKLGDQKGIRTDSTFEYQYRDYGEYTTELIHQLQWMDSLEQDSLIQIDTVIHTINLQAPKDTLKKVPVPYKVLDKVDITHLLKPSKPDYLFWLLLSTYLLLWTLYELWQWRKMRWIVSQAGRRGPPLHPELSVSLPETPIFKDHQWRNIFQRLRERLEGEHQKLNIPQTIRSSIAQGDFPDFQYTNQSVAPHYLVIIESQRANDHLAEYWKLWVRNLNQRDIAAEYFIYEDHPDVLTKEFDRKLTPRSLEDLYGQYGHWKLIIIGDPRTFIDRNTGEIFEECEIINHWEEGCLLNTRPTQDWGFEEKRLHQLIPVLPADRNGLDTFLSVPEKLADLDVPFWRIYAPEPSVPSLRDDHEETITTLRHYLGKDAYRWLCACALYPELKTELSLGLFEHLEIDKGKEEQTEKMRLRLFALPCFREGEIKDELREFLIRDLKKQGGDARKTREFLIEILEAEKNSPVKGSMAEKEQQLLLAIYKYQNAEHEDERKRLVGLIRDSAPGDMDDMVSLQSISSKTENPLALILPPGAYREGVPILGLNNRTRLIFAFVLLVLGVLAYGFFKGNPFVPTEYTEPFRWENLKNDLSPQDSAQMFYYRAVWQSDKQNFRQALDSIKMSYQRVKNEILGNRLSHSEIQKALYQASFNFLNANYQLQYPGTDPSSVMQEAIKREFEDKFDRLSYDEDGNQLALGAKKQLYYLWQISLLETDSLTIEYIGSLEELAQEDFFNEASKLSNALFIDTTHAYIDALPESRTILLDNLKTLFASADLETQQMIASIMDSLDFVLPERETLLAKSRTLLDSAQGQNSRSLWEQSLQSWMDLQQLYPDYVVDEVSRAISLSRNILAAFSELERQRLLAALKRRGDQAMERSDWRRLRQIGDSVRILAPDDPRNTVYDEFIARTLDSLKRDSIRVTLELFAQEAERIRLRQIDSLQRIANTSTDPDLLERILSTLKNIDTLNANSYQARIDSLEAIITNCNFFLTKLIYVEGGTFWMGSEELEEGRDTDELLHQVKVGDFEMEEHEVTNQQFLCFLNEMGNQSEGGSNWYNPNWGDLKAIANNRWNVLDSLQLHPITGVSWYGARAYAIWVSQKTGLAYRLPTEAEWEFAAGGGLESRDKKGMRKYRFSGSDKPDDVAIFNQSRSGRIKQKTPNALGLYDMSGNVWEWCQDWYNETYYNELEKRGLADNPNGPENGVSRVLRGGSWVDTSYLVRFANRLRNYPNLTVSCLWISSPQNKVNL